MIHVQVIQPTTKASVNALPFRELFQIVLMLTCFRAYFYWQMNAFKIAKLAQSSQQGSEKPRNYYVSEANKSGKR